MKQAQLQHPQADQVEGLLSGAREHQYYARKAVERAVINIELRAVINIELRPVH